MVGASSASASRLDEEAHLCLPDLYERALRDDALVGARCAHCRHAHFPPQSRCPECQSVRLHPMWLSGRGQLCSAEIAEHPDDLSIGHIMLEEGIALRALVIDPPAVLAQRLGEGPLTVVPAVVHTHGLAIVAFRLA